MLKCCHLNTSRDQKLIIENGKVCLYTLQFKMLSEVGRISWQPANLDFFFFSSLRQY